MPRPQRPIDPDEGPVQAFAADLRAVRARAGDPKFATMSRRSGRSKTALSEAVGGRHLPRWETVVGFVEACGGRPPEWRTRWEEARGALSSGSTPSPATPTDTAPVEPSSVAPAPAAPTPVEPEPVEPAPAQSEPVEPEPVEPEPVEPEPVATAPVEQPPAEPAERARATGTGADRWGRRRSWWWPFGAALVAAALAGAVVALLAVALVVGTDPAAVLSTPSVPVVVVQNKVAVGPDELLEDSTPAYLSTLAAPYCKSRGCAVPGTDMASGAVLPVECTVRSEDMTNYEADSVISRDNPNRARSTLWFRARFPDGRAGFLSAVYIEPAFRDGSDLPTCAPSDT